MRNRPLEQAFQPEPGNPRRSFSVSNESPMDNVNYLNAYIERVRFLAGLLEYSSQPFSLVTPEGQILDCNPAFLNMVGYTREELSALSWDKDLTPCEWHEKQNLYLSELERTGLPVRYEKEYLTKDGRRIAVELLVHRLVDQESGKRHYYSFITDISQRKKAEESLRQSEQKYRLLFENTPLGILHFDSQGRITTYNDSLAHIVGSFEKDALLGFNLLHLPEANLVEGVKLALQGIKANLQEDFRSAAHGNSIPIEAQIAPVMADDGTPLGGIIIVSDITERKNYEETIRHLAYHDALTGLPNRLLIHDRISVALPQAHRQNKMLALVYLDLDNFKFVNDTLGHLVGDHLLLAASQRLKSLVRQGDTIARMGGDEFMFLFPDIKDIKDAGVIAGKILQSFSLPYQVDGQEIHVTASIGISIFPTDGTDVQTLIKNADKALYRAKEQGGNTYQIFTPAMNKLLLERNTLAKELRHALEREEFLLHYQPSIDIRSGQIVSMEALLRWQHPKNGLIMPEKFIHVAEETGLIIPLEKWVLNTACRQNKMWQDEGLTAFKVAVNISGLHFWQHNLVKTVAKVLEETGLDPKYLELEITESVAVRSTERVSRLLQDLRNLGIQIALDGFGTGYSSLSYLKNLPLDSLKIDQSFINELSQEDAGLAIPHAVISLARFLKLRVTAQRVESPEQFAVLSSLQCDQIQGYLACRPQPAHCISQLLAQTKGSINFGSDGLFSSALK